MNATAIQSAVNVNKPLTMQQIKQMLNFAQNDNLDKPLIFGMTVRSKDLEDQEQMKRLIAQHLFDSLTEISEDDGSVIIGKHRITYVGVQNYEVQKQTETLFQRVEAVITATITIEQEKV